jgi:hypothetical protein
MATNIRKAQKPETVSRCAVCGHLENEHGTTGTQPCLAMVGDLLEREFCACDEFRVAMRKVA